MTVQPSDILCSSWRFLLAVFLLSFQGCKKESKPSVSQRITFATWPGYIGEDVLSDFTKETGTDVRLLEFGNPEQLESVLQEDGGSYDVICTYHSIVNPYAKLGMFGKLNPAWLPNRKGILPAISNRMDVAHADYTVPYLCGHMLLIYNKRHFPDPPDSWNAFWNPEFRDKVALINDPSTFLALSCMRETGRLEFSGATNATALASHYDELLQQCGIIADYQMSMKQVDSGDCLIGNIYNGAIHPYEELFPNVGAVIPKEGTTGWIDCLALSRHSKNTREAHRFIDFLLRPDVAAKNAQALGCPPVVEGALSRIDASLTANRTLYPAEEDWRNTPLTPEHSPGFVKRLGPYAIAANKRVLELKQDPPNDSPAGESGDVIRIANWPEYINLEILERFKAATGVTVTVHPFDGITDLESRLQEDLGSLDLFVVDRAYLRLFLDHGYFLPLNKDWLPNLKHVAPSFHDLIQPDAEGFCVPYFSGTSVIVYNRKHINPAPDSWNDFLDPRYRGRVGLVSYPPDFLALAQLDETETFAFREFKDTVARKARFRKFLANSGQTGDLFDTLVAIGKGDLWIGNAFGGDVHFLQTRFPDLAAVIPKEGVMRWLDCLVISRKTKHAQHAHRFMNFLLRPEIAAKNADTQGYDPMVTGARKFMDSGLLANPVLFPGDSIEIPLYPEATPSLRGIMEDYEMEAYRRTPSPSPETLAAPPHP